MIKLIIIASIVICGFVIYGLILGVDKCKSDEEHEREDREQMNAVSAFAKKN